jgi:hypothetical protein
MTRLPLAPVLTSPTRLVFPRVLAIGLIAGSLGAGCTPAPPPSRSAVAARAACQAETEATYNRQNRDLISQRDQTDTPFSTSGLSGITTTGLSREYARESMLDDCLKGTRPSPSAGAGAGEGTAFQGPVARTPSLPGN